MQVMLQALIQFEPLHGETGISLEFAHSRPSSTQAPSGRGGDGG